ncbi:hypothetical protein D9757_005612 [Collybiopsis confluens]|uniref:Uncharacterized protein n=1 Tax=Collybiopsis confluens TaxID=2823264 RepID=A0A8H5MCC1_9AGAR|nr:hypothetical protein D9757_005612 [Collybiopsis confluens]
MERTITRSRRASLPSPTPQLNQSLHPTNLRRSPRLSVTDGLAPSQFTLPTSSNKRKRTLSISSERPSSRSSKRSHTLPVDTPAQFAPSPRVSSSPRLQRHRRRHPSVFEGEESLDTQTEKATASTSTQPFPLTSSEGASTKGRTSRKENKNHISDSRDKGRNPVQYPNAPSTLKGKERAHSVTDHIESMFGSQRVRSTGDDSLQMALDTEYFTRSRSRTLRSSQMAVGPDDAPIKSDRMSEGEEGLAPEPTSPRRLRSANSSKASLRVSVKKRKRERSVADEDGRKKSKTFEAEFVQNFRASSTDVPPAIPFTISYPNSLPNPIPSVIVTPPSPRNSPPPVAPPSLPVSPSDQEPIALSDQEPELNSESAWPWPPEAKPPITSDSSTFDLSGALPSGSAASSSSSEDEVSRGRLPKRVKRICRRQRKLSITDRPPETLFRLACRERVDYLKLFYLGQLKEYEADLAYQFFTRVSSKSSLTTADQRASIASPSRPQSPTWNYGKHWQDRLHDSGVWDGEVHDMHPPLSPVSPSGLPPSMFTLRSGPTSPEASTSWDSKAWNNIPDGDLDFRTEDYFPFELDESDDDDEDHRVSVPMAVLPGEPEPKCMRSGDEELEDTDSDDSEESDDLSTMPPIEGEGQIQLNVPVYIPTPSSLAEALTPLETSDDQDPVTSVFALPVSPLLNNPIPRPDDPIFTVRPDTEDVRQCPTPFPLPPPSLATFIPEETRLHDADQLSVVFRQEVLPEDDAARVKISSQNVSPLAIPPVSTPALLAEVHRQATERLRTPFTRLLNYASKTLGSIGDGTPIDPKRRMSVVAWLEDQEVIQGNEDQAISEASMPVDVERMPAIGSASWYATRFQSLLSPASALKPTSEPNMAISSPEVLLSQANLPLEDNSTSFDASNWPPLTVQPSELNILRNQRWIESKDYFPEQAPVRGDAAQGEPIIYGRFHTLLSYAIDAEFRQRSSQECGTDQVQYRYPHSADRGMSNASTFVSPRLSPEIAMDESLSDEDAEGDIDPDIVPSASSNPSANLGFPVSMPVVAHRTEPYAGSITGISPLSNEATSLNASDSAFRDGRYGSSDFRAPDMDINMRGAPDVEIPTSVPVPSRSFQDGISDTGIHGVGMSLNVGVSVMGMGMGINMMGVGFGMEIGFPALESSESWFLPGSSPPSSLPSSNEENEHALLGSFGNHPVYVEPLHDHTRDRFGSPGSPESAYPLGFAMG